MTFWVDVPKVCFDSLGRLKPWFSVQVQNTLGYSKLPRYSPCHLNVLRSFMLPSLLDYLELAYSFVG
jgi:hypothetical protein